MSWMWWNVICKVYWEHGVPRRCYFCVFCVNRDFYFHDLNMPCSCCLRIQQLDSLYRNPGILRLLWFYFGYLFGSGRSPFLVRCGLGSDPLRQSLWFWALELQMPRPGQVPSFDQRIFMDLSIFSTRSKLEMLHVRATVEPPCHFLYRFLVENVQTLRSCKALTTMGLYRHRKKVRMERFAWRKPAMQYLGLVGLDCCK